MTGSLSPNDETGIRRRRLLWRASHRGTKELDLIIGGYASAKVADMDEVEFSRFERFLDSEEPDLQDWILGGTAPADAPDVDLIRAIRRFHGLE